MSASSRIAAAGRIMRASLCLPSTLQAATGRSILLLVHVDKAAVQWLQAAAADCHAPAGVPLP